MFSALVLHTKQNITSLVNQHVIQVVHCLLCVIDTITTVFNTPSVYNKISYLISTLCTLYLIFYYTYTPILNMLNYIYLFITSCLANSYIIQQIYYAICVIHDTVTSMLYKYIFSYVHYVIFYTYDVCIHTLIYMYMHTDENIAIDYTANAARMSLYTMVLMFVYKKANKLIRYLQQLSIDIADMKTAIDNLKQSTTSSNTKNSKLVENN